MKKRADWAIVRKEPKDWNGRFTPKDMVVIGETKIVRMGGNVPRETEMKGLIKELPIN